MKRPTLIPAGILALLVIPLFGQGEQSPANKGASKGDFFIVSSIDVAKKQILLKRPTEVTELMRVNGSTRCLEEHGKSIRFTDLRAGDTVYIVSSPSQQQPVAITIQKGPMTMEVLRERFLKTPRQP